MRPWVIGLATLIVSFIFYRVFIYPFFIAEPFTSSSEFSSNQENVKLKASLQIKGIKDAKYAKDAKEKSRWEDNLNHKIDSLIEEKMNPLRLMASEDRRLGISRRVKEDEFIKTYPRVKSDFYQKDHSEEWFEFPGTYVTFEKIENPLLQISTFRVTTIEEQALPNSKLIYNENQKIFAILTGKVILKIFSLMESDQIAKDYHLQLERASPEINTFYFTVNESYQLSQLSSKLGSDARIEKFHFEIVRDQWQKN